MQDLTINSVEIYFSAAFTKESIFLRTNFCWVSGSDSIFFIRLAIFKLGCEPVFLWALMPNNSSVETSSTPEKLITVSYTVAVYPAHSQR